MGGHGRRAERWSVAVTVVIVAFAMFTILSGARTEGAAVALWLSLAALPLFAPLLGPRVRTIWRPLAGPYTALWVLALVHLTGGMASPHVVLLGILAGAAALFAPTPRVWVTVGVATAAVVTVPLIGASPHGIAPPLGPSIPGELSSLAQVGMLAGVYLALLGLGIVGRRVLHRMHATEATLRLLADHSDDTLYRLRLHPQRAYDYVSPGAERTTGFTAAEFLADPDLPLRQVHPDDRAVLLDTRTSPEDLRHEPVAFRWRMPDGSWRWLEERLATEVDDRGRLVAISGIVRDITHQKGSEEALRAALEREREATELLRTNDELKTIFLRGVSHEIRTPLTGILGFSTTLRDRRDRLSDAEMHRLLGRITANARRIARLVDDLLDVDRLSRGDVEPMLVPTALHALVSRCAGAMDLDGRPIELQLDPVVAEVDAAQMERVVENLVSNAVRHTPSGSPVVVRLGQEGAEARLTIEDRGPGVPEDQREAIFEPFVQGPLSARSPSPGIGIGLALVKKLVDLHHGRVEVEDVPGGGARFSIVIPLTSSHGAPSPVRLSDGVAGERTLHP